MSRSTPPGGEIPGDVQGESRFLAANGRTFHAVVAGPADGDLALLLHGFPEFWYAWRAQVGPLAEAGYRVVAPDLRGYNLSEKPSGVRAYHLAALADDVVGLVDALGRETATLVGHDWGGIVAWWVAIHHPARLRALLAVNAPHPTAFRDRLATDPWQVLRNGYGAFAQLPWLPEAVSRAGDWWLPTRIMRASAMPGTFDDADLARYRRAWSRLGAFTAMVNWYRAAVRYRPRPETDRVTVPTRVLWGAHDQFLKRALARESRAYCVDGAVSIVYEATHWLQHERPAAVVEAVRDLP